MVESPFRRRWPKLIPPLAAAALVVEIAAHPALERYAGGRASRAVRELEAAAPRQAPRRARPL